MVLTLHSRTTPFLFAAFLALVLVDLRPAQAVEVEKIVNDGGIEAWLVEDHTVPIITLNFSFEGGTTQDPDGQDGLTRLLAATLDEGAGDLTSEAYQGKLEELAVSIGFSAGRDRFVGNLRTLTDTLDEATDLLALALQSPRFDAAPMERMKTRLTIQASRNETSPNAIARQTLAEAVFGDHVYGRTRIGTRQTLAALTSEDLHAHHRNLITRNRLKIGAVGAIDAETLKTVLDKVFGKLPAEGNLIPVVDVEPHIGDRVSRTLDGPQTTILLALPGLKREDPDYQAAFVMNHILGGGTFTSWMFSEVRKKRGLSYSVSTYLSPYAHSGLLVGSAATRADRASETVAVMIAQLERMTDEGPTADELDAAKRFLTGSYPLRFDSSAKIARQLVALQTSDLEMDYFDRRNDEIEAVTLEDVQRVARRLIGSAEPTIILVGPDLAQN